MKAPPPNISHLYRKYDEIALDHCKSLIAHLYEGKVGSWVNPITGNTINNGSYITISFLSKCYYLWGNKIATINSKKLKYKKHIEKFIAKEYLFDISAIKQLAVSKQKKKDKAVVSMNTIGHRGGLLHGINSRSPSNSPPAARRRSPSLSPPAAQSPNPLKLEFPVNIRKSSNMIVEKMVITGDELTKERCNNFLTDIEDELRGKTKNELSNIKFKDPINEKEEIDIGTHKLLIYLSKCYHSFDKPIKDRIEKIVNNVDELIVLTDDKEKIKQAIPIIEDKLKKLMDNFNKCCDKIFHWSFSKQQQSCSFEFVCIVN